MVDLSEYRRVYDCETAPEILDFISVRYEVPLEFVKMRGHRVYIGSVKLEDLYVESKRIKYVVYQRKLTRKKNDNSLRM